MNRNIKQINDRVQCRDFEFVLHVMRNLFIITIIFTIFNVCVVLYVNTYKSKGKKSFRILSSDFVEPIKVISGTTGPDRTNNRLSISYIFGNQTRYT